MSVRMINLSTALQLPGAAGATRCINLNTMANIRVERVEVGFEVHFGKLVDGKFQASGIVKTVTWANVMSFDEERTAPASQAVKK
jgi:hypothetical protein